MNIVNDLCHSIKTFRRRNTGCHQSTHRPRKLCAGTFDSVKFNAMYGKGRIGGQPVILMKPLSYMNLSGGPIREMANYFKINPETEMIVIYDDIDLDPGQLRIRKKGSAGGHNGIKHIIQQLGTQNFVRIKVGVGAKPKGWDLADYVLGRFD